MKILTPLKKSFLLFVFAAFLISCSQGMKDSGPTVKNTYKSVSTYAEFEPVTESELKASLDEINNVIAEIGYPGAGYTLWRIENPDIEEKFMVEGNWPDHAAYDVIHQNESYTKVIEKNKELWDKLSAGLTSEKYSLIK